MPAGGSRDALDRIGRAAPGGVRAEVSRRHRPARLGFVSDIARLERFGNRPDQNGLALLITNEAVLWMPPKQGVVEG
ncbi:hypothetical protein NMG29_33055 [Streptomyces cocklensis]|uniref:Uncharacterized protein n=1 Tax=Actinacidiphila cocklensis TaxID=887465 RepID=A0A9W4DNS2_9ACTN|nr:hypothetical protein [Actinacidiphila cocklensis]MDD1062967.1 hypothetical protein [Actinacidiphila cocklensis]CAG6394837.1 hypothetical protein SCOCK_30070 [Actinacidiphila cocklensis]